MNAKHDNLRDTIGQTISDAIGSDGGEIDCYDSKEIDRIADAVIAVLPAPSAKLMQLPPLTDVMYHAVRGTEFEFSSGGANSVMGYIDDNALDDIWENINTALRVARMQPAPNTES